MTLGRPFKAGNMPGINTRQRRLNSRALQSSLRDEGGFLSVMQALKGLPKVTHHYVMKTQLKTP